MGTLSSLHSIRKLLQAEHGKQFFLLFVTFCEQYIQ